MYNSVIINTVGQLREYLRLYKDDYLLRESLIFWSNGNIHINQIDSDKVKDFIVPRTNRWFFEVYMKPDSDPRYFSRIL